MSATMKWVRKEVEAVGSTGVSPLLLGSCSALSDLATKDLVRLSKVAECRFAFEGEEIFERDQDADSVYMLLDGGVHLERFDETGVETAYDVEAAYATFGDVVLLGEPARRYTATALQDTLLIELPLRPLVSVLGANAAQAVAWRGSVLARLHRLEPHQVDTFAWRILDKLTDLFEAA